MENIGINYPIVVVILCLLRSFSTLTDRKSEKKI
jgi:hypothetical protein